VLAQGGLRRLDELNRRRRRNYEILETELAGSDALHVIGKHPDAARGGFYRFVLKYSPEHARGRDRRAFVEAANLLGLPVAVDPYPPLHLEPLFANRRWADPDLFGRLHAGARWDTASPLPATEHTCSELITLPPFTKVPERSVRHCARALRELATPSANEPVSDGDRTTLPSGRPRSRPGERR
jgi:dTDP-4-amino-4,6-dideoxygalactose transaminase